MFPLIYNTDICNLEQLSTVHSPLKQIYFGISHMNVSFTILLWHQLNLHSTDSLKQTKYILRNFVVIKFEMLLILTFILPCRLLLLHDLQVLYKYIDVLLVRFVKHAVGLFQKQTPRDLCITFLSFITFLPFEFNTFSS